MDRVDIEQRVRAWVEQAVVGLGLCPFADPVVRRKQLEIRVSGARNREAALGESLLAAVELLEGSRPGTTTVLLAFPSCLEDFEEYLGLVATLEGALVDAGAEGVLQVASFHPKYRFEGQDPEHIGNWTNRSPVPAVHLLREADVAVAIADHPDPEGIPAANIRRLEALGEERLREIWSRFSLTEAGE